MGRFLFFFFFLNQHHATYYHHLPPPPHLHQGSKKELKEGIREGVIRREGGIRVLVG